MLTIDTRQFPFHNMGSEVQSLVLGEEGSFSLAEGSPSPPQQHNCLAAPAASPAYPQHRDHQAFCQVITPAPAAGRCGAYQQLSTYTGPPRCCRCHHRRPLPTTHPWAFLTLTTLQSSQRKHRNR
ncbi:hypothetical protein U0070_008818 [Myodes glareolus]|uniref:Uncharacterized protein n=1 Tax=Myodes glareolus TaxID=447135 RepID=A0AAW0IJC8_MYOGA